MSIRINVRNHLQRLAQAGIDPIAAQQIGQLEVRTNTEVYAKDIEELLAGKRRPFRNREAVPAKERQPGVGAKQRFRRAGNRASASILYGALEDIKERKHAEEAIRASEVKLRQVIDTIPTLA